METPDSLPNPFSAARIVGIDTDQNAYHKLQGERGKPEFIVSNSMLKEFSKCPRKWRVGGEPERDSDACRWGELLDARVLSPKQFGSRFSIIPAQYQDAKTGEMKDWTFAANVCKEWRKDHTGTIHVKTDEMDGADDAIGRLQNDEGIAALLACSQTQVHVAAEYRDRATGLTVPVKGLIDLAPSKDSEFFRTHLADLKTARDGSPSKWKREVFSYGYHIQAAFYLDMFNAATGEARDGFYHVVSENIPPYEPAQYLLSLEFIEVGRRFYRAALAFYCQCLNRDEWPSYGFGLNQINGWTICEPEAWMVITEGVQSFPDDPKHETNNEQSDDITP